MLVILSYILCLMLRMHARSTDSTMTVSTFAQHPIFNYEQSSR
jgi:hypothetical protein